MIRLVLDNVILIMCFVWFQRQNYHVFWGFFVDASCHTEGASELGEGQARWCDGGVGMMDLDYILDSRCYSVTKYVLGQFWAYICQMNMINWNMYVYLYTLL